MGGIGESVWGDGAAHGTYLPMLCVGGLRRSLCVGAGWIVVTRADKVRVLFKWWIFVVGRVTVTVSVVDTVRGGYLLM